MKPNLHWNIFLQYANNSTHEYDHHHHHRFYISVKYTDYLKLHYIQKLFYSYPVDDKSPPSKIPALLSKFIFKEFYICLFDFSYFFQFPH